MKREEIKFEIDQLRKDKIIYAVESAAVSTTCLLVLFFASFYLSKPLSQYIAVTVVVIGVVYHIYMGVGNFLRLKKVKKLEKQI